MATNGESTEYRKALVGSSPSNFWLHTTRYGFDLTHPSSPTSTSSGSKITLQTTTSPITISPSKSALVIIDMQNFFLSPAFGRPLESAGHSALKQLVDHAIPAARKAGIRIVWLNWGLTEKEVKEMPPAVSRAFGFEAVPESASYGDNWTEAPGSVPSDKFGDVKFQGGHLMLEHGAKNKAYRGLGSQCGMVELEDGKMIDAGRLLMRDTWNAALCTPLDTIYSEGSKAKKTPDVWIHKNRMSGMWGATTDCEDFLEKDGIKTLFFAGVNTDQCVGGTFTDSFSKGYDCILLSDGCGTTSPDFAQQCFEFNAAKTFGFCMSCEDLAKGVEGMEN